MLVLNQAGEDLIKGFEELRLTAYDDDQPGVTLRPGAKISGTLTIGWGHTGPDVRIGQTITPADAERLFLDDTAETQNTILSAVTVPLSGNQFSALTSFAFNIGDDAFRGSTLRRKLNAGDYAAVPVELAKWTKTTVQRGSKRVKVTSNGLARRRAAEANLWSSLADPDSLTAGERGNQVGEPPAEKSKATDPIITGGVIAGGGAILSDVAKQIEPLIGYADSIKWLFLAVSLVAIAVVVWTRIRHVRDEAS